MRLNSSKSLPLLLGIGMLLIPSSPKTSWSAVAVATISMSGDIETVFQMSAFGMSGDLDLTPNVSVTNRLIGLLHFKYNVDMASLVLQSNTASGKPEKAGTPYPFGATPFQVSVGPCTTVNPATVPLTAANLAAGTTDIKSAASASLGSTGIEEDCRVTATWSGGNSTLALSGTYSMTITVTMTSI